MLINGGGDVLAHMPLVQASKEHHPPTSPTN